MELQYDQNSFGSGQFNGNIAATKWKSAGDQIPRSLSFAYDPANRLTMSDFNQINASASTWTKDQIDFSVAGLQYDANGNILSMKQKGLKLSQIATIDSLEYIYSNNSNQLKAVIDHANDPNSLLGDFKDSTTSNGVDYVYDNNGNMVKDFNKRLFPSWGGNGVYYDHNNLPQQVFMKARGAVYYYYTATGEKLFARIDDVTLPDSSGNPTKIDKIYDGVFMYNATYQNGRLVKLTRQVHHEEGRIRFVKKVSRVTGQPYEDVVYDYFIKDHLGNVRAVLTEERDTAVYAATMETIDSAKVRALFSNVYDPVHTVVNKPVSFDQLTENKKVSVVNGSDPTKKIGPSIVLKVMAKDTISLGVYAWYNEPNQPPSSGAPDFLNLLVNGLAGGIIGSGVKHGVSGIADLQTVLTPDVADFLSDQESSYDNGKPKAFLNWVLFDEQFNYVAGNSGVRQVEAGTNKVALVPSEQIIQKNGYLYIYVSNESPLNVYFDDLVVSHKSGPLVEETHYYPFGLTMSGISTKAPNRLENKYLYNGKELQNKEFSGKGGGGLEWYDYGARMYDPQIGRWHVIDNYSDIYYALTPYNYAGNTPVNAMDIDGNLFIFANGFMLNHWKGGENTTKEYRYRADPGTIYTVPNSNRYAPDRGFYSDGPHNAGKEFEYWNGVDLAYMKAYKDKNSYYTNGSFTPQSSASARFKAGEEAGLELISKLVAGEISLNEGETIKIVGHSQGAAYAAGIAFALANYSKYGGLIEFVDYLSPHQPGSITHPNGVKGRQFSTESDEVSSKGLVPKLFGNSKYEKIKGTEWGVQRKNYEGERGGHSVETWLDDLIKYWRDQGITVSVIE